MAWHLNEALTDLSLLPRAMYRLNRYYKGDSIALPPEDGFWTSRVLRSMYRYLEASEVNIDHFEWQDIPDDMPSSRAYYSPHWPHPYRWLARDILRLVQQLGLIEDSDTIKVTNLGSAAIKEELSLDSIVISGLLHWQIGENTCRPIPHLLEILRQLDTSDAMPCPGLMLPEFIRVMRLLERGETGEQCLTAIQDWRATALDNNVPAADAPYEEIIAAQEVVCDYLANVDESIMADAVRGRTTQIVILASGLAIYGGLLEPVQFMVSNPALQTILDEHKIASAVALSNWLKTSSPLEVANTVEQWLEEN